MSKTKVKKSDQPGASNEAAAEAKGRYVPTPEDQDLVENFLQQRKRETAAPKMKFEEGDDGVTYVSSRHPDGTVGCALMAKALGTADAEFINAMLNQLSNATGKESEASAENLNFVLSAMSGVAPRDRVEAMLAAQM